MANSLTAPATPGLTVLVWILGILFTIAIAFGIWLLVAWIVIWLLPIATAGAVTVGLWQAFAGVALLSVLGGFFARR